MKERYDRFNNPRTEELKKRDANIVGPESMLENHEVFAHKIETSREELAPGVQFEQCTLALNEEGDFTNRYRVVLEGASADISFSIDVKSTASHIQRNLVNNEEVVCSINGGFFLLVDEVPENISGEMMFGTVVRDGTIESIQSHDRPVLWVDQQGELQVTEVFARGQVTIGEMTGSWAGSHSNEPGAELTLFGLDSCEVKKVSDPETGTRRVIDEDRSKTPQENNKVDLICAKQAEKLVVTEIRAGGGTFVGTGSFILQGDASMLETVSVGQPVHISCPDLVPEQMSSAITVGPSVAHFENEDEHPINHDKSLGDNPPFIDRKMARSIIYKTTAGNIIFELFDGAPKTNFFKGVTPKEVVHILKQDGTDTDWAYFLDPGQSARLAVRHADGTVEGFGNQHYIRWPKIPGHPYVWSGEHGREVPSVVSAKIKSNVKE